MVNTIATVFGILATVCNITTCMPQLVQVMRTNDTSSISEYFLLLYLLASIFGVLYAAMHRPGMLLPVFMSNLMSGVSVAFIGYYKMKDLLRVRNGMRASSKPSQASAEIRPLWHREIPLQTAGGKGYLEFIVNDTIFRVRVWWQHISFEASSHASGAADYIPELRPEDKAEHLFLASSEHQVCVGNLDDACENVMCKTISSPQWADCKTMPSSQWAKPLQQHGKADHQERDAIKCSRVYVSDIIRQGEHFGSAAGSGTRQTCMHDHTTYPSYRPFVRSALEPGANYSKNFLPGLFALVSFMLVLLGGYKRSRSFDSLGLRVEGALMHT